MKEDGVFARCPLQRDSVRPTGRSEAGPQETPEVVLLLGRNAQTSCSCALCSLTLNFSPLGCRVLVLAQGSSEKLGTYHHLGRTSFPFSSRNYTNAALPPGGRFIYCCFASFVALLNVRSPQKQSITALGGEEFLSEISYGCPNRLLTGVCASVIFSIGSCLRAEFMTDLSEFTVSSTKQRLMKTTR